MAENSKANTIAKILFIIGGLILFVLLAVFILRLIPWAISNISNLGSSIRGTFSGEEIEVSTNTTEISNSDPFVLNFTYTPEVPGAYTVTYDCHEGLFFDIQSATGPKRLICNNPFTLGDNISAISLVPVVTKSNIFIDSTLTISYKNAENEIIAKGSETVTIRSEQGTVIGNGSDNPFDPNNSNNQSATSTATSTVTVVPLNDEDPKKDTGSQTTNTTGSATTKAPTYTAPSYTYTPSYTSPTYTYTPTYTYVAPTRDLVVTQIFRLDNQSTFIMYVYNYGNTATGPWQFSYTDAGNPSDTLISPAQPSLGAGQGLAVTTSFNAQRNSNQHVSVILDPYNAIGESNESNNTASITLTGRTTGGSGSGYDYDEDDDADLYIEEMEVGYMSGSRFREDDEIDEDDTMAVRFIVRNQGGESTGSWRFEIDNLPYDNDDSFRSSRQDSLKPGQSAEIIAEFEGIDDGDYTVRVEVDSDDDVDEERENNNTRSRDLEVRR